MLIQQTILPYIVSLAFLLCIMLKIFSLCKFNFLESWIFYLYFRNFFVTIDHIRRYYQPQFSVCTEIVDSAVFRGFEAL